MKKTLVLALLALQLAALPALAEGQQISFDGSTSTYSVGLASQQTHTLYESREVPDTCYRREFVGYRPECRTYWRNECYPHDRCRDVREQVCDDFHGCRPV